MEELHNCNINRFLEQEFDWLKELILSRFDFFFHKNTYKPIDEIQPPLIGIDTAYEQFLLDHQLGLEERVLLVVALAKNLKPELFNSFLVQNPSTNMAYPEFGGIVQGDTFIPTYRSVAFLLNDIPESLPLKIYTFFEQDHFFYREHILDYGSTNFQNRLNTPVCLTLEIEYYLLTGRKYKAEFNADFPAQEITTNLKWDDLIVSPKVQQQLEEILKWHSYREVFHKNEYYSKWIKKGYRSLFFGPPGTGKTLAVSLIGKKLNLPVYRVDLSMIVSKYIGETIKNLEKVFARAEYNQWILFFDEADAIFGSRSQQQTANDRHANQEVAYLLQRIETYPELIILATNLQHNLDEAFIRRFQSMVHFKTPDIPQRITLWKAIFHENLGLSDAYIKLKAEKHALTGGMLINILQAARLLTHHTFEKLSEEVIDFAIERELKKEENIF